MSDRSDRRGWCQAVARGGSRGAPIPLGQQRDSSASRCWAAAYSGMNGQRSQLQSYKSLLLQVFFHMLDRVFGFFAGSWPESGGGLDPGRSSGQAPANSVTNRDPQRASISPRATSSAVLLGSLTAEGAVSTCLRRRGPPRSAPRGGRRPRSGDPNRSPSRGRPRASLSTAAAINGIQPEQPAVEDARSRDSGGGLDLRDPAPALVKEERCARGDRDRGRLVRRDRVGYPCRKRGRRAAPWSRGWVEHSAHSSCIDQMFGNRLASR